jgi:hypothetical protein
MVVVSVLERERVQVQHNDCVHLRLGNDEAPHMHTPRVRKKREMNLVAHTPCVQGESWNAREEWS